MEIKNFFRILFTGHSPNKFKNVGTYQNQINKIRILWNNDFHTDIGIERLLRLFLLLIQWALPGFHVRAWARERGSVYRDLIIELYVILKTILPYWLLLSNNCHHWWIIIISFFLIFDTLFYIASLFFLDDLFPNANSYRRSIIMLFINYFEFTGWFACYYFFNGKINISCSQTPLNAPLDYLYFSFVTSATIGYGDFIPSDPYSKLLVISQSIIFLIMVVMFFSFFISKIENLKK